MKTFFIIHGIQGHAGKHWQAWLKLELEKSGQKVIMPTLPNPDHPDRTKWLEFLKEKLRDINTNNLVFVTHSLGAVTAMDYIEQSPEAILGLVSVSGFARDYGMELNSYFLKEKHMDMNMIRKNVRNISIIFGNDDPYVPQNELKYLSEKLNVEEIIIENGGHLNTETGYTKFPLLLEECLKMVED